LFFSISLSGANLGVALLTLAVSSLAFIGMGLGAAVFPLISPEKESQATHIFQAVILLISGVYYDVSVLPPWIRPLSALSPATYTLRAARAALLEGAGVGAIFPDLCILLVLGAILIPLGLWIFERGEHYAMRTGKLKRNG
jgi:ABC-2 type transport system permease protein